MRERAAFRGHLRCRRGRVGRGIGSCWRRRGSAGCGWASGCVSSLSRRRLLRRRDCRRPDGLGSGDGLVEVCLLATPFVFNLAAPSYPPSRSQRRRATKVITRPGRCKFALKREISTQQITVVLHDRFRQQHTQCNSCRRNFPDNTHQASSQTSQWPTHRNPRHGLC